ncbi:MAG: Resolvase protein, partial [Firmicutes bacterium]|nr:Resolvase protein [Bacillota bacterium]
GMVASHMKDKGNIRHYYRCVTKSSAQYRNNIDRCSNRYIPVDILEEDVWQTVVDIAKGEAALSDYLQTETVPDRSRDIAELTRRQEDAQKKRIDIMKWYRSNLLDTKTAEAELETVAKEIATIAEQLSGLKNVQDKIKKPPVISPEIIMEATTTEEKRKLLLQYGLLVHVKRIGKNYEFWFSL